MARALSPILLITTAGSIEGEPSERQVEGNKGDDSRGKATLRFVNRAGYQSHLSQLTMVSAWPLQPVTDLETLAALATDKRVLYERPREGDLFLKRDDGGIGFARTGIVTHVLTISPPLEKDVRSTVLALDGVRCAASAGQRTAFIEQLSSQRGDCFVRWVELDSRIWIGSPTVLPARTREYAA